MAKNKRILWTGGEIIRKGVLTGWFWKAEMTKIDISLNPKGGGSDPPCVREGGDEGTSLTEDTCGPYAGYTQ